MCKGRDVKCKVEVIELKNGYQIQVTGDDVKDAFKPENLKGCIEACCSGEEPFKKFCRS